MRILIITPFYPPNIGGVETSLYTLAKLLRRKTHEVKVVSYKTINTKLYELLEGNKFLQALHLLPILFVKALWTKLRYRPDAVHGAGLIGGLIARLISRKCIITTHCIYSGIYRLGWVERLVFRGATKVLCLTKESMKEIGTPNCVEYKTLVDWELFKPMPTHKIFDSLFIGRPIKKKGIDIADKIGAFCVGSVPNEDIPYYINQAKIVVVPSLYKECFSRVILESLFCDTPVIASKLDVARNYIPKGVVEYATPKLKHFRNKIDNFKRKPKGFYRDYAMYHYGPRNLEVFINAYKECSV